MKRHPERRLNAIALLAVTRDKGLDKVSTSPQPVRPLPPYKPAIPNRRTP